MQHKSQVTRFYKHYLPLIRQYMRKIEIADAAIELSDIEQELKMKLYQSIIAYGKKWAYYRKTGKLKPIPIEYYIKTTLNNRMIDLYKGVRTKDAPKEEKCIHCGSAQVRRIATDYENGRKIKTWHCHNCEKEFVLDVKKMVTMSFTNKEVDLGYEISGYTRVDFTNKVIVVGGYDILLGLNMYEKGCICLYLKGYDVNRISKIFKNHFDSGKSGVVDFLNKKVNSLRDDPELKEVAYNTFNQRSLQSFAKAESED